LTPALSAFPEECILGGEDYEEEEEDDIVYMGRSSMA